MNDSSDLGRTTTSQGNVAAGKEPSKGGADTSEAGVSGLAAPAEKQLSEGEEQPWQRVKGKSKKEKKGNRSGQLSLSPPASPLRSGAARKEADPGVASTPKGGVSQKGKSRGAEKALVGAGQGLQGEKQNARRSPRDLTPKSKPSVRGAACGGSPADDQDGEAQPASDDKVLRSGKKLGPPGAD